jgi:hypothetical protein
MGFALELGQALKAQNLTDAKVDEVLELGQWAWVELNYRPHAYQGRVCVVHIRRSAHLGAEGVTCTFILGPETGASTT